MSLPKIVILSTAALFLCIGLAALVKGGKEEGSFVKIENKEEPIEIELQEEIVALPTPISKIESAPREKRKEEAPLPKADRIAELFNKTEPRLPFVETIVYKSRVPWLKGRPAWISEYASYYHTSKHFIARGLNGKPEYFKQNVAEGDRFNVFKKDKNIAFHILIDSSRCQMWLYALDLDADERYLLKTYPVCLGRLDGSKPSGMLTPLGKYSLGNKIAVYKPKTMGMHNGQKIEMAQVFGSRWIPFDNEIEGCTAPAKGFGLHGIPLLPDEKGNITEDKTCLGKYESDGCIRLAAEDVEEVFAIVITKPTTIELTRDFHEAKLPGAEK